ncbi:hypothetical protein niasHT_027893 [Heterodera trifolii]|uniref:Uncharacterized protein n=1 Tax=Heterodera trifolii TaxID=157864 RepID=A0ABD2KK04_9BILA
MQTPQKRWSFRRECRNSASCDCPMLGQFQRNKQMKGSGDKKGKKEGQNGVMSISAQMWSDGTAKKEPVQPTTAQRVHHGTPIPLLAENNLSIIRRIWNNVLVWLGGLINNRQQPQQLLTIFHNVFDGFLIGSSAGAPLSCLSISAALLCKRSKKMRPGKSMKMNLVLHLVSALTCAIGFSSGLLIDLLLYDTMVKYGFACGSGMFFYFSAVCMLPEMNVKIKQQLKVSGKKAFIVLLVQMIGVVLGVFFAAATGFFNE